MNAGTSIRRGTRWMAAGVGIAAGAYATYAAVNWFRYGRVADATDEEADELLDRFMPHYEIAERHHISVNAPAALTLAAAKGLDTGQFFISRAIFNARALILGGPVDRRPMLVQGLAAQMQTIGWRVLAEVADQEIVFGAVTKPWQAEPAFRGIAAADFAAFNEPDYVKIVWTLRADPAGQDKSIFRSETRACTTDRIARRKFRFYWSLVQPGVAVIRRTLLGPVKREAERKAKHAISETPLPELRTAV